MNTINIYFQKNKFATILIFGILLSAILAYFLLWPSLNRLRISRANYLEKNEKLTNLVKISTAMQQKQSELNLAKEQLDQLSQLVPAKLHEDDLVAQLSAAAAETGVKLVSLSFTEAPKKAAVKATTANKTDTAKAVPNPKLTEVNVPISIEGSYQGIEAFLNRVTKIDRLLSVQSITFAPGESSYGATINAKTFINK